jgi:DNA-binding transcriptional LysR family regulator
MHDVDTALLRTFVALAETRSFSRTAVKVGRSQSAVSAQVQKLETLLGCTLFDRDKRNVRLSAEGERLLGYAHQMIQLSDAMIERFRTPEVAGEVRFGSPEDFATRYLPEILAAFAQAHPGVRLNVNCDLTLRLIDGFEAGDYDLIAIKQDPDDLYPEARPLWRERLVWAAAARPDRAEGGPRVTDFALDGGKALPLVLSPPPCVYRGRATTALDQEGIGWKIAYSSPSFAGSVAAVRAGLGVTVLPATMVPEGLVTLDPGKGWPTLPDAEICLLSRPRASAATEALASFIEQQAPFYR